MDGQLSFATLDYAGKKKRTKRDVFLAEMAATVLWSVLEAVIAPHYPQQGPQGGRRAFPIAVMLRIYCLQQGYNLSDPGAEEALYDIQSMHAFCDLELGRDPIPDETTILNFRHLLEAHGTDEDSVRSGGRVSRSARGVAARWHDRRCDINRCLAVHQERGGQARSADAFFEEGQSMVLRHEGARWRRCQQRACAHRGGDERQRSRCEGDGPFGPRRRHCSLWRQGLRQRYEEARRGGGGGALGGEGESQTRRQADGSPACPQSQVRQGARESRACVSRR